MTFTDDLINPRRGAGEKLANIKMAHTMAQSTTQARRVQNVGKSIFKRRTTIIQLRHNAGIHK